MPRRVAGVQALRAAVQENVDRSSLRAVAEEIGMSPSGLDVFLKGSRPHQATVQKLGRWLERQGTSRSPVDSRDIDSAIELLRLHVKAAPSKEIATRRFRRIVESLEP